MSKLALPKSIRIGNYIIEGNGLRDSWKVRHEPSRRIVLSGLTYIASVEWAKQMVTHDRD